MIESVLQLRHSLDSQGDTDALLIPGGDAQTWINEISSWPVEHAELKLLVIPTSQSNLSPTGLLVFGEEISKALNHASPSTMNFSLRAGSLFIPTSGQLFPPVQDQLLSEVLPIDSYCVWHPVVGLTTFSPSESLSVAQLVTCSRATKECFDAAVSGTAINSRMHSLTLLRPPELTAEEILGIGKGDIGDEATNLDQLKPIRSESDHLSINRIANMSMMPFAKLASFMISKVPGTASQRTWLNDVEDWANGILGNLQEFTQRRQFMDIYRLQKMLEENPDEGLKYAMPLSSMMSSTLASTSSWLSQRLVNFSFGNLGSGGVAGPGLPADLHSQLMMRYRELAEREIRLGRYRRAAYIYGNLLYDLASAAKTLESGKHFREAALVYQKKLHRNDEAARCLKEGGYFSEAIELFESLEQFENAGDLYAELGLENDAHSSWRTAAEHSRKTGNLIETARIEETKLKDEEAAIGTLESCWPGSYQTALCMNETFRLLGRNGLHQRTRTWVAKFEAEGLALPSFPKLVDLTSKTATDYPDQETRNFAEDSVFRSVSQSLTNSSSNSLQLLGAISRLHPDDSLLRRDCNRYVLPKKEGKSVRRIPRSQIKEVTLIVSHQLREKCEWENAVGIQGGYLIAGRRNSHILLKRISADFRETAEFESRSSTGMTGIGGVILATRSNRKLAVAHAVFDTRVPTQLFAASDGFHAQAKSVDLNLDSKVIGICAGPRNQWLTLRSMEGHWVVDCLDESGALVSSRQVNEYADADSYGTLLRPPFYCDGHNTWIAQSDALIQVTSKSGKVIRMGDSINSIVGSVRGVASRLAVSLANGFRIVWADVEVNAGSLICDDMPNPILLFTRTGHLVVASGNRCEVFHTRRSETKLVGKIAIPGCRALFRTDDSAQFGLLDQNGQLLIYQIPL